MTEIKNEIKTIIRSWYLRRLTICKSEIWNRKYQKRLIKKINNVYVVIFFIAIKGKKTIRVTIKSITDTIKDKNNSASFPRPRLFPIKKILGDIKIKNDKINLSKFSFIYNKFSFWIF